MAEFFALGVRVRDKITKFEGITTGRATYITGCDQYLVQAESVENKRGENQWFDAGRLEAVGDEPEVSAGDVQSSKNGACGEAPTK